MISAVQSIRTAALGMLVIAIATLSASSYAAEVQSISGDKLEQEGNDGFWQAEVTCVGSSTTITVRQPHKGIEWCDKGGILPCANSKQAMAQQACANVELFAPARSRPAPVSRPQRNNSQEQERLAAERRAAQQRAQREAQEAQRRAELAAELQAQELALQEERATLEKEKLDLQQEEMRLEARAQQVEDQLNAIDR